MNYIKKPMTAALLLAALTAGAAVPDGYYDSLVGKKKEALKKAAKAVVRNHTAVSYGTSTWDAFESTDTRMVGGKLTWWDMYSPETVAVSSGHPGMNIEHSVPNSWWGGSKNDAYKDLFHLNPSDTDANSWKSNYPLGEVIEVHVTSKGVRYDNGVTKVGYPASGTCGGAKYVFEPADEYKGDFARAYFYMFTTYDDIAWQASSSDRNYMFDGTSWPSLRPWAYEMLLEWAKNDPVSQKEIDRNEAIYKIQHNRNPYIDLPELAEYVWGSKTERPFTLDGVEYPDPTPGPDDPDPTPGPVDPDPVGAEGTWSPVTAQSQITEGAEYVLVATEALVAMDYTCAGKYMENTGEVTISGGVIEVLPHGTAILTLEDAGAGRWHIIVHDTDGNRLGYLTSSTAKNVTLSSTPGTSAEIEAGADATVIFYGTQQGKLLYNAAAPRFTTYTSNQQSVRLYRRNAATDVVEIAVGGATDDTTYDLFGRRVNTTDLRPGIYVRAGRKIIVR